MTTKKSTASNKKSPSKPAAKPAAPAPAKDPAADLKRALQQAENTIVSLEAHIADLTPRTRLQMVLAALRFLLQAVRPKKATAEAWDPLQAAHRALTEGAKN